MTVNRFEEVMENLLTHCKVTLCVKAEEYATGDRMHNFKVAGELQECTPVKALLGMMSKHVISIYDMCNGYKCYEAAKWDEKIGDAINYLILLRALVEDTKRIVTKDDENIIGTFDTSTMVELSDGTICCSPYIGTKRANYCAWHGTPGALKCEICKYNSKNIGNMIEDAKGNFFEPTPSAE